jgi:outer membrane protein W
MIIARIVLAAFVLASTCLTVQAAESGGWTLRVYGAMVDSSADIQTSTTGVASSVDVGGGLGVGGEFRMSDRLGLELSALFAGLAIETSVSRGGGSVNQSLEFDMVPLTLGLAIHLNPEGRTDVFVAPTVSYVSYFRLETSIGLTGVATTVDDSSDMALGAAFGVDIPVGKGKWAVSTGLRYMKTDARNTDVDPLIVTLGFSRRF